MNPQNRRQFIHRLAGVGLAGSAVNSQLSSAHAADSAKRRMTINLSPGSIGVSANQVQAIALAHRYGFESVDAAGDFLGSLSDDQLKELLADMKSKGVVFGSAGLPVDFRQDDARFQETLSRLPKFAASLQRAGVQRVGTYLSPGHDRLTYLQNFRLHADRLRAAAQILQDHGQRLGLEYVGTLTLRTARKFPFVHCLHEQMELIAAIGVRNVGVILDSWHWWQAGDTVADILALHNEQVVSADLNDAPAGVPKEQQRDNRRELPAATGVIEAASFLNALNKIGFDGPVRAEPFNQVLNNLNNDEACAATAQAMKKAFALIE